MSNVLDFASLDVAFQQAKVHDPNAPVPDGKYVVIVDAADIKQSKKGDWQLAAELKIVGPTSKDRKFFRYYPISTDLEVMERLKTFVFTVNPLITGLSEIQTPEQRQAALLDRVLNVRAVSNVSKKDGKTYQNVYIDGLATQEDVDAAVAATVGPTVEDDIPF